jgi:hypothetical protein
LKKISSKLDVQGGIKGSGILRRFQNCAQGLSLAKGKTIFYKKTEYLGIKPKSHEAK